MEWLAAARAAKIRQPRDLVPEAGVQEPDQGERKCRTAGEPAVRGAEVAEDDVLCVNKFHGGREVEGPLVSEGPVCRSDAVVALVVHGRLVVPEEFV